MRFRVRCTGPQELESALEPMEGECEGDESPREDLGSSWEELKWEA